MTIRDRVLHKAVCERHGILVFVIFAVLVIASQTLMLPSFLKESATPDDISTLKVVCVSDTHGLHEDLPMPAGRKSIFLLIPASQLTVHIDR